MPRIVPLLILLLLASVSLAQVAPHSTDLSPDETATAQTAPALESHPLLSDDFYWVPIALILIGMMFLSAMVIGPIVRMNMPEEIPPAHSHDEPPGTSHHHGKTGTVNPAPEADLPQPHGH